MPCTDSMSLVCAQADRQIKMYYYYYAMILIMKNANKGI